MPFLPPRESAKSSADTAAQTQEARLTPFPWSGDFRPRRASAFSPSEGKREQCADTAAQTQEARLTPFPGTGEFRPRRASAFLAAFGGGDAPLPGRGAKGGTRHLRFLIPPLATPPDLPLAATPCGRASKMRGERRFYVCALFLFAPLTFSFVICRAYQCAAGLVAGGSAVTVRLP